MANLKKRMHRKGAENAKFSLIETLMNLLPVIPTQGKILFGIENKGL